VNRFLPIFLSFRLGSNISPVAIKSFVSGTFQLEVDHAPKRVYEFEVLILKVFHALFLPFFEKIIEGLYGRNTRFERLFFNDKLRRLGRGD